MLCGLLQENMATPEDVCRLESCFVSTWFVVAEMTSETDSVMECKFGEERGGSGAVFLSTPIIVRNHDDETDSPLPTWSG